MFQIWNICGLPFTSIPNTTSATSCLLLGFFRKLVVPTYVFQIIIASSIIYIIFMFRFYYFVYLSRSPWLNNCFQIKKLDTAIAYCTPLLYFLKITHTQPWIANKTLHRSLEDLNQRPKSWGEPFLPPPYSTYSVN